MSHAVGTEAIERQAQRRLSQIIVMLVVFQDFIVEKGFWYVRSEDSSAGQR
jgi:hypothetical protein